MNSYVQKPSDPLWLTYMVCIKVSVRQQPTEQAERQEPGRILAADHMDETQEYPSENDATVSIERLVDSSETVR